MNRYLDDRKVFLDRSIVCDGFGVYAKRNIKKDEIVEAGIMTRLKNVDGNENPHLFTWSDDRTVWAMGSGHLPFYNYSDTPNCRKVGDLPNDRMVVYANCDIRKGEELTTKYHSKSWRKCFQNF